MQTRYLKTHSTYDGRQLGSLWAYLNHGLLGNSIVSWKGPCHVDFTHMVDGEDLREQARIEGGEMLHFVIELFDRDLFAGVTVQRLMAAISKDYIEKNAAILQKGSTRLERQGDDIYFGKKKLSISIATKSPVSTMVHFAMNVTNQGTPVETCALSDDFGLDAEKCANDLMSLLASEVESCLQATRKVRPVP